MSEPKSSLELFLEGLLRLRSSIRSLLPETCTRHQAETYATDLAYVFRGLPITVNTEASAGRYWLVISPTPSGAAKLQSTARDEAIIGWLGEKRVGRDG